MSNNYSQFKTIKIMHNFLTISQPTTIVLVPFHVNLKNDNNFEQHLAITDDEFDIIFNEKRITSDGFEFIIAQKRITCDGFFNFLTIEQCKNIVLSDDECSLQEMFECFGEENIYIIENFQGTFNVSAIDDDDLIDFELTEFFYNYIDEDVEIHIETNNSINLKEISFDVFSKLIDLKIDEPKENFEPTYFEDLHTKRLKGFITNLVFENITQPKNNKYVTFVILPFFVEQPENDKYFYVRLNSTEPYFDPKQILTLVTIKQCLSIDFGDSNIFDAIGEHADTVNIIENFNGEISYNPIDKSFQTSKESNFKTINFIEFGRLLDANK